MMASTWATPRQRMLPPPPLKESIKKRPAPAKYGPEMTIPEVIILNGDIGSSYCY